jgi:hypothetical protein
LEIETRAKQMIRNKTLFDLWNIDRNVGSGIGTCPEPEDEAQSEISEVDDRITTALQILQDSFHIDAPNRNFEKPLKETAKNGFFG